MSPGLGRPQDGQIGCLRDVLGTLEDDILEMFWDRYFLAWLNPLAQQEKSIKVIRVCSNGIRELRGVRC